MSRLDMEEFGEAKERQRNAMELHHTATEQHREAGRGNRCDWQSIPLKWNSIE